MANILAVGIAALDIINTTDGFPEEDDEVRALSQEIRRGGNSTNTLVVLSQLGHQCNWLGSLTTDTHAKIVTDDLERYGVNYQGCEIHKSGSTPTSYITQNQRNGSRTIVHYRNLPEMSADNFKKFDFGNIDWIHFEGRNVSETLKMLSHLTTCQTKIPVSIEIEKDRDNLEELFCKAGVYFFSKAFATSNSTGNTFNSAEACLRHYRKLIPDALLVCTWGDKGAYALENDELYSSSAPRVSVVDTIGAGDTFNAGFIHALLAGNDIQECLDFGCRLAAKKCSMRGFDGLV